MILVIDNYDSFTYNLVQYLGELGAEPVVYRNDQISLAKIKNLKPKQILISPGPCTPNEAGISCKVIEEFTGKLPILGVCLGHQCVGQVFGGKIIRAGKIMHGKTSEIVHTGKGIFQKIKNPFQATRYHSLLIDPKSMPKTLKTTAWVSKKEIMGIQHVTHPTYGVQFHPESILTYEGKNILKNFLKVSKRTK